MKIQSWQDMDWGEVAPGVRRKIITGKNVMIAQFRLDQGTKVPAHSHPSEQISFVVKGALQFWVAGQELIVSAGQVLVIPPDVPHKALAVEESEVLDSFSPIRQDWLDGTATYFTQK